MLAWAGGWGGVSGFASYYIAASIVSAGRHLDCSTHVGVSWEGVGAGAEGGEGGGRSGGGGGGKKENTGVFSLSPPVGMMAEASPTPLGGR